MNVNQERNLMNKVELQIIKEEALNKKIPIIMDDTLNTIKNILLTEKPKRVLEVGTAVGYSALCFSEYVEHVDTIEIEEQRVIEAKENMKKCDAKNINVIHADASVLMPKLQEKYDLIFIDAAKGKYLIFLEEALRLINKNGIIIADNILYKGYVLSDYNKHKQRTAVNKLREYIKIVTEDPKLKTEILEVGDGLAITHLT